MTVKMYIENVMINWAGLQLEHGISYVAGEKLLATLSVGVVFS